MALNLHTKICDMLGIEYPVFAFTHCRDVAAAVSGAGGFGVLGTERMRTPQEIITDVEWMRKQTDKPFGLDMIWPQHVPHNQTQEQLWSQIPRENIEFMDKLIKQLGLPEGSYRVTDERADGEEGAPKGTYEQKMQWVETICKLKPNMAVLAMGGCREAVQKLHDTGIRVACMAGRVRHVERMLPWGPDIFIAIGTDAGGHTGTIGTMALVPQVVDAAGSIPVIAGGGIGDGRGLVAALALGAVGVWTGSIWLLSHEYPLEEFVKEKLVTAKAEDFVLQKYLSGKSMRALKTKYIEYWDQPGAPQPLNSPFQGMYQPILGNVGGGASDRGDRTWEKYGLQDWLGTPSGQILGMAGAKQRRSARQILYDMVSQAIDVLED